ncbi:ABC transporter permease [Desulfatitalea alkaliphila]|uniref:ABC transporter permease subunit n=1 Tax=Desulfatitalea alkaliphila TaxID=2929485 RepID=A0AA41UIW6_9BACT|nr:ABC transporter permease subunit [Desulfatitalea alkaliphila]MCJ8501210.1 ABC transporter permease subunit [Desulfatitalea alkaliphila]
MRQTLLIFNKEFKDYFASPIAYIVIAIFLAFAGWLFFSTFFLYDQAEMRRFFDMLPFLFALLVPIITMRLFAEELNTGSYELLLTLPVTLRDIIFGKFLAAVAFVAAILLPTLFYALSISWIGDLDWGVTIGGFMGALLLGAAYAAIGLFTSALTRNQIIACIAAIVICVALAMLDQMLFFFPPPALDVLTHLSANAHFKNIAKGIVDSRDLLYFFSIAFLGLYATHLAMEDR